MSHLTGISPAEMLFGRRPRTILDLILPDVTSRLQHKQEQQKSNHDKQAHERSFQLEDKVYVRKFPTGKDWTSGKVVKVFGPRSFKLNCTIVQKLGDTLITFVQDSLKSNKVTPTSQVIGSLCLTYPLLITFQYKHQNSPQNNHLL